MCSPHVEPNLITSLLIWRSVRHELSFKNCTNSKGAIYAQIGHKHTDVINKKGVINSNDSNGIKIHVIFIHSSRFNDITS